MSRVVVYREAKRHTAVPRVKSAKSSSGRVLAKLSGASAKLAASRARVARAR